MMRHSTNSTSNVAATSSPSCWLRDGMLLPSGTFVVIERDGEERLIVGVFRRQRLRGIGGKQRVFGRDVERFNRGRLDDLNVGESAIAVHVKREHDVAAE